MQEADYVAIAQAVYAFAERDDPLAKLVKEALHVIDEAFDAWGCVHTLDSSLLERNQRREQGRPRVAQLQWRQGL